MVSHVECYGMPGNPEPCSRSQLDTTTWSNSNSKGSLWYLAGGCMGGGERLMSYLLALKTDESDEMHIFRIKALKIVLYLQYDLDAFLSQFVQSQDFIAKYYK